MHSLMSAARELLQGGVRGAVTGQWFASQTRLAHPGGEARGALPPSWQELRLQHPGQRPLLAPSSETRGTSSTAIYG